MIEYRSPFRGCLEAYDAFVCTRKTQAWRLPQIRWGAMLTPVSWHRALLVSFVFHFGYLANNVLALTRKHPHRG